jgi:hypothetical protein
LDILGGIDARIEWSTADPVATDSCTGSRSSTCSGAAELLSVGSEAKCQCTGNSSKRKCTVQKHR